MKLTKKRVAIATAAAALVTAGIFGGTYAKYNTETGPKMDQARLAKFYLQSDNELSLFNTEYINSTGTGNDVKNDGSDYQKVIAPNVATTNNLSFTVATEVKSKLTFSGLEVRTNLPTVLWDYIKVTTTAGTYTLAELSANPSAGGYEVATVIPAGTTATQYQVPVTFEWALENGVDDDETAAAIEQVNRVALGNNNYDLIVEGNATLTQID